MQKILVTEEDTEDGVWTEKCLLKINTYQRKVEGTELSRGRRWPAMPTQQKPQQPSGVLQSHFALRSYLARKVAKTFPLPQPVSRGILHCTGSPVLKGDLGSTSACLPEEGVFIVLK